MNIPSPDALLIDLVDRGLAHPQRRGIVLPRILGCVLVASVGCLVVESAVALALGQPAFAAIVACLACGMGWGFGPQRRLYRQHVSNWGPDLATQYRALAAWHRQSMIIARLVQVVGVLFLSAYLIPRLDWSRWAVVLVVLAPMATAGVLMLLHQYGACAMPRDPDLRQESRRLAGQGA